MAENEQCIEHRGTRNADGYGVLTAAVNGSRLAHRAALAAKLGRPVNGVARHTCDNPSCINPAHLIEGTQADNMRDAVERGRVDTGPRTDQCVRGHDVMQVGRGHAGQCNSCRKEDAVKQARKRRAERHERGLQRPTPSRFAEVA